MRQVQGVVDLDKQTDFQVTSLSDRLANTNNKLGQVSYPEEGGITTRGG